MKLKLNEVKEKLEELIKVSEKKLPVRISYAIAKNIKILTKEYKTLEEERLKLCREYAEKDTKGQPIIVENTFKISTENEQKLEEEYVSLVSIDVELEICMIEMKEFEKCDQGDRYDHLTAADFVSIEFMIK